MYRRRGLQIIADNSKVMMLGGEEGLKSEICMDGACLEQVSEFKYFGCVLDDESGTNVAECHRKVRSGRKVAYAIWLMLGVCSLSV